MDLLYSTGTHTHYLLIIYNGKNLKKNIYLYITESFCCNLKLTHYKSIILQ